MTPDPDRLAAALARFDAANSEDPHKESFQGREHPKELLYAERMSAWLDKLEPDASEALKLAVRAQHIRRWTIPRANYPMDRAGYKQWRTTLAKFHAQTAGEIMGEVGYDEETIARVQSLLRKERLKLDPEAQLLEDVACLVFMENYLLDFAQGYDEAKLIDIVRKTWIKMSDRGHAAALALPLPEATRSIVAKALG